MKRDHPESNRLLAILLASIFIGLWQQSYFAGMASIAILMLWDTK